MTVEQSSTVENRDACTLAVGRRGKLSRMLLNRDIEVFENFGELGQLTVLLTQYCAAVLLVVARIVHFAVFPCLAFAS